MKRRFQDKVVWVTGASSGIGEALALGLSREGALLILSARRRDELERVRAACGDPQRVLLLPLDLAQPDSLAEAAQRAEAWQGRLDILINNAGISQRAPALEASMASVRRIMEINFFAAVALARAVTPGMADRGQGQLVLVSSVTGYVATPLRSAYAASKHALQGWFDALRAEVATAGVRVTVICPGFVRTEVSRNALVADGSAQQTMDSDTDAGLSPERFADKALRAIARQKREAYIGGAEIGAIYLKRWLPGLLAWRLPMAKPH